MVVLGLSLKQSLGYRTCLPSASGATQMPIRRQLQAVSKLPLIDINDHFKLFYLFIPAESCDLPGQ